ncbi:MAG: 2-isopropylmalate synthase [SAR324 cluster bacterium]|nr:2-isopropylmalate synthase [SAR324 cluster bacterium]MCZ6843251.1 2-isopropylmalate synthase [SAR324 cluster bacterium]
MSKARRIQIFDTTLRDGEQAPGFTMNAEEKMQMAQQLARLGVDTIEAGFAAASPGDFDSVREIGHAMNGPMITSLCRTHFEDIDASAEALKGSPNWGIHIVIASSPLHMKHKLMMEPDAVLESSVRAVERARGYCGQVEFSAEDATRSEPEFLVKLFTETVKAGATVINIPDTVGYTTPTEYYELIDRIMNDVPGADQITVSVHCHNDLGMAVANSLAALRAGASQVECTINGIGERAGNASLEEIVMALKTRSKLFNLETGVQTEYLYQTSRLLTQITGMSVQSNKAIVGANAFAHEAGIHQDGVLKNPLTYEIMTPESVGIKSNKMVLGKHSGRHALADRLRELGYEVGGTELNRIFKEFKRLADLKKTVYDEDIEALVSQESAGQEGRYVLRSVNVSSGTHSTPTATVEMEVDGEIKRKACFGDGPVDAAMITIKEITGSRCSLTQYMVNAITGGTDALGEVTVSIEDGDKTATGRGADLDIVVASAKAFVSALNRLALRKARTQSL